LRRLGRPALPVLAAALEDQHDKVRRYAAWSIGKMQDPGALPHLRVALEHDDPVTRFYSVWALGALEESAARALLLRALADSAREVRLKAEELLWSFVEHATSLSEVEDLEVSCDEVSRALYEENAVTALEARVVIARLTNEVARRKDDLVPKRALALSTTRA